MRYEYDPPFVYVSGHDYPFNLVRYVSYVLPQYMRDHIPYKPNQLPVVANDSKKQDVLLTLSILRIMRGYRVRSSAEAQLSAWCSSPGEAS